MYFVAIRNNLTGEIRFDRNDFEFSEYWWTEGNASCDCNLRSFFYGQCLEDSPCGDTAFTPLYAVLHSGTKVELCNPPSYLDKPLVFSQDPAPYSKPFEESLDFSRPAKPVILKPSKELTALFSMRKSKE